MRQESKKEQPRLGLLTKRQFLVLQHRANGLSQLETAKKLSTSRANVSMIELRARKKIDRARDSLRAYDSIFSKHYVKINKGTRLQDIPRIVLSEGDRSKIHLRSNLVEVIRMVKSIDPPCLKEGRITRDLEFAFTQGGFVSLS
ncbi:MAG: Tfx family DNA-binding protein [Nitrososphaerales archaeon]